MSRINFIDVGARKGRTARWLLRDEDLDIHIYMFEPNPISFKHLEENFSDNKRVTLYNFALSDKNGMAKLYWDEDTGEGSSLYADKKTSIGAPHIKVTTLKASSFIRDLPGGPIVFYSNCEGSEFEILDDLFLNGGWEKISLWSIAFHHGDRKIPSMKPTYFRLQKKMDSLGIVNVPGHFHKSEESNLEEFVQKVRALAK